MRWEASRSVVCPHSSCGRSFEFAGQRKCPFCLLGIDDGVPLFPNLPRKTLLDRILPSRGLAFEQRRERAAREFQALLQSWAADSNSSGPPTSIVESRFAEDFRIVLGNHEQILVQFRDDVEKFLYSVPVRLAKYESEYSWKLEEALTGEINSLLDGVLYGRHSLQQSIGFIARDFDRYPQSFSRRFLASEIRRRFYERRSAPRPGFQLTLEYARTLDGVAFEEWLSRLLRDAGVPGVFQTQASRDQGADIIVTLGTRKIVVQAKQYQDTLGNKSVQEAFTAMHYYNAGEAWVVTTSTFSRDAIDLAFRIGVRLVDGSRLMNLPELICGPSPAVVGQGMHSDGISNASDPILSRSHLIDQHVENGQADQVASTGLKRSMVMPAGDAKATQWPPFLTGMHIKPVWGLIAILLFLLAAALTGYRVMASHRRARTEGQIQELLGKYLDAERARSPQLLAACYAPRVETFYLNHGVSESDVQLEFQRAFIGYDAVHKVEISRIVFSDVGDERATATFDKEWDLRGTKNYAGKESEQMIFQKIDGNWRIVSERELKIYWTWHMKT